jgi:2-polyprenyl-6-methoxyphenol hydroxylase-like FAD-dependent oxidoreductase
MDPHRPRCCIAGGGPAGIVLGYLLARAGIETLVLEKHKDFLRDFRGDTVHPSTLDVMAELGLLDDFLKLPHQEIRQLQGLIGDARITVADFSHVPTRCKFVALMPQWHFLNFLAERAARFPTFRLMMQAEVRDVIESDGRIVGIEADCPQGPLEVRADLVIGADGRHSVVRSRAGLVVEDLGAPIDVLWMSLSRKPTDPDQTGGYFNFGHVFVALDRGDYWQCAFVIRKGEFDDFKARGIEFLRSRIARIAPMLNDRVEELKSWDDVKLLTVRVDRLRQWARPGLLCIGDAAHAMSPIGGVGINLAVQDAVAAARLLTGPLLAGRLGVADLARVRARRAFPTAGTQLLQRTIQRGLIGRVLGADKPVRAPLPVRLVSRWPALQALPARVVGVGLRPERLADRRVERRADGRRVEA